MLFDTQPLAAGPAGAREPTSAFLARAAGAPWERVRATLEQWVTRLPADARPAVVGQLRSRDDRQFKSALWELYVHEALLHAGFTVEVHPSLTRTTSKPDFLARRAGVDCYVECVVAFGSDADFSALNRVNDVYDTLDKARSPNFFLELAVIEEGPAPLAAAKHRKRIEHWLEGLDPDELDDRLAATGEVGALYPIREDGWHLEVVPHPKPVEDRGVTGLRPIGSFAPAVPGPIDDITPIRRELTGKSRKYGRVAAPFVVALMVDRSFADNRDVASALYGTKAVVNGPGGARWIRRSDGFFRRATGDLHDHVSAVLCAFLLQPASLATTPLTVWPHPSARAPVDLGLGVAEVRLDGVELRDVPATVPPHEVVGLPARWPGFRALAGGATGG